MIAFAKRYLLLLCCFLFTLPVLAQNQQPLPVDQAFQLTVKGVQNQQLQLHWQIAPGYHLYRDRFQFLLLNPKSAEIGQVILPPGIPKHDDILGDYQIYQNSLDLQVPFINTDSKSVVLLVKYQGCADSDFCYPPETKRINVDLKNISKMTVQNHEGVSNSNLTIQDKITHLLEQKNYVLIWLVFIGFGLLLAFTPCVLPMIPILSGIIVGQDKEDLTTRRAFLLSLSYVIGMSLTYAVAGVLVAMAGSHLAELFQAPWVIVAFSILFIILALSLFDLYHLRLPHFVQNPVVHLSNRQRSGSYIGAVIMGALSVLIVSPCVTAPLVGVLTFIAHSGDVFLGSTALFALGIGMGLPLLVIGTTEGKYMPKSGAWMHVIKIGFGVLLLGVAIYLLQRVLPGPVSLILWAGLLIIISAYLGVGGSPGHSVSGGWENFGRGLGLLAFSYGIILLVGAALGNDDPLLPLHGMAMSSSKASAASTDTLVFQRIKSISDLQNAITLAHKQNKPVMLDFYADWCVSCHEMARTTFSDPAVKAALKDTVLLQADITANDPVDRALEDQYKVIAPPTMLFFDRDGSPLPQFTIVGAVPPQDFIQHLELIRAHSTRF